MGGQLSGRCLYGEWADRKWQPQLSHKITTPKLSMESSKSESFLTLFLSHLWAPHVDLSRLSCSQATPSFQMHNLHLCVGDRPAHRFVFDGSFDHMSDCGWSLCHSETYSRMQNSVVCTDENSCDLHITGKLCNLWANVADKTQVTVQCLGPYRCIHHLPAVAILTYLAYKKIRTHLWKH